MDGILIVDKPQGMTSHDVVDIVRRRFNLKKAGHAGTLDPMATGVLVMLMGSYTKLSDKLMAGEKDYEGTLILGGSSDTGDAWGKISASGKTPGFTREEIEVAFSKFSGEIDQTPPMYSAVKVNGSRLYKLARKGITVAVAPRKVSIKDIVVTGVSMPEVSFKLTCSKGTYIRQLCVDIGNALGCGAYMSALRRTRSGDFKIGDAVTIDGLKTMNDAELQKKLITI